MTRHPSFPQIRIGDDSHFTWRRVLATRAEGTGRRVVGAYLASGVAHVAVAVCIQAVFGAWPALLVPPPHGTNSVDLVAQQVITVQTTSVDDPRKEIVRIAPRSIPSPDRDLTPSPATVRSRGEPSTPSPDRHPLPIRLGSDQLAEWKPAELARDLSASRNVPADPPQAHREVPKRMTRVAVATPLAAPSPASRRHQGQQARPVPHQLFSPPPEYPVEALKARQEGLVVLRVEVDARGHVADASVLTSSGVAALDQAALDAVRRWRFEPARRAGIAVGCQIAVPVRFRIEDALTTTN